MREKYLIFSDYFVIIKIKILSSKPNQGMVSLFQFHVGDQLCTAASYMSKDRLWYGYGSKVTHIISILTYRFSSNGTKVAHGKVGYVLSAETVYIFPGFRPGILGHRSAAADRLIANRICNTKTVVNHCIETLLSWYGISPDLRKMADFFDYIMQEVIAAIKMLVTCYIGESRNKVRNRFNNIGKTISTKCCLESILSDLRLNWYFFSSSYVNLDELSQLLSIR